MNSKKIYDTLIRCLVLIAVGLSFWCGIQEGITMGRISVWTQIHDADSTIFNAALRGKDSVAVKDVWLKGQQKKSVAPYNPSVESIIVGISESK